MSEIGRRGVDEKMEAKIVLAKKLVERWVGVYRDDYDRKWIFGNPPDSYGDPEYRVAVYVLEGSPPRGTVLADYAHGIVKCWSASYRNSRTFRVSLELADMR